MPIRNEGKLTIIEPSERCLSDAILDGMKRVPIARSSFATFDQDGKCTGACAVGAAVIAECGENFAYALTCTHRPTRAHGDYFDRAWLWEDVVEALWPYADQSIDGDFDSPTLQQQVYEWNDEEKLTRAQTAARVRKIEQAKGIGCNGQ